MEKEQESIDFILELGTALHRYGTPAHRLEVSLLAMAGTLDLDAQIFTTPTSIMMGFGTPGAQRTALIRVEPGFHNLEKLSAVDILAERVAHQETPPEEALAELHRLKLQDNVVGHVWTTLAFPVLTAAFVIFLGGGLPDMAAAASCGLVIGLLALLMPRTTAGGRVFELIGALVAGAFAHASASLGLGTNYDIVLLASLITLVPGLTLTVGMTELATQHLVSGTARLTAAGVVFLEIIFGVALAEQVFTALIGAPPQIVSQALPPWTEYPALLVACLGVAALFKAHPRDFIIITFASVAAFYSARLGAAYLSTELGACVGGFVAAAIANAYARIFNRSAMVPLVPGILLLVPGSLGFRSLESLWEQDVVSGIDGAFKMVLVAIALVAGILVANAVVLPRRAL